MAKAAAPTAVVFPYDHSRDPMNPGQLADQIQSAASLSSAPVVDIDPTHIFVTHSQVTEQNRAAIQALIDAYVFDPIWSGGPAAVMTARMTGMLANNQTFLAAQAPTQAQVTQQVRSLTRQVTALIRIVSGQLDSTDGT